MKRTALGFAVGLLLLAAMACAWETGPVERDCSAAGNAVADASLEDGTWEATAGGVLTKDAARTGNLGAAIRRDTDKELPQVRSARFPAAPGRWLVSTWMRTEMDYKRDPNYSAVVDVVWLDDAGTRLSSELAATVNGYTHAWVYRERPVQAPAGTAQGELVFRFNWSSTGTAWLDDVAVTPLGEASVAGPDVTVSLSAAERIFEPGTPLSVQAGVRLAEGPPRTVALTMDVVDARGKLLTSGRGEVTARSDRDTPLTIAAAPADVPVREHLVARVNTDPPQGEAQEFGLLVIPRPTDFSLKPDSPFALLVGHSYTKRWLGARWERPNFNWNEREMELPKRYGVNYVGMINTSNQALTGQVSLEDYGQFVYESVSKFKHLVKYWQLGNEPNLYQPGIPEKWAEVLKVGYEAAHRADPDCLVMWGGITGLDVDPAMVDKLLANGGGDYTDIIDVHLYVPIPRMDALLARVRADMKKHGVDKPIVITEVTGALGTVLPEREKASHVYKRYAVAESHGVLASWWFVMHWVNTGEFRYCSLIDPGTGEPHEAAAAYARLTEALEDTDFDTRIDCGEGAYVYRWRKGDRWIYVAWKEGAGVTGYVSLASGEGEGTVTDVAGHQWPIAPADSVLINLRDEPLLIDVPAGADGNAPLAPPDGDAAAISLARGATIAMRYPSVAGAEATVEAPDSLDVQTVGPGELQITAKPDARLGQHWIALRYPGAPNRVSGLIRREVTVTPPLRLEMTPLPDTDGAGVFVSVTNLSETPMSGRLTLTSPVSTGARQDTVSVPFSALEAGETGTQAIPLQGIADPLARYDFSLSVQTQTGVVDTLQRTLVFTPALRAETPLTIDGKLDDWGNEFPIVVGLNTGEQSHPQDGPPAGPEDISARAALRWDDGNLYLAVRVTDDTHLSDQRDGAIWDGDGLQFGFAPEPYIASSAYYEWGVSLTDQGTQAWAWRSPAGRPTGELNLNAVVTRGEGETLYEMAIPWSQLPPMKPEAGMTFGFGLCVNEKDTANRGNYCWHAGISGEKDRARFGQVTLAGE